jgi:hypothetical protein
MCATSVTLANVRPALLKLPRVMTTQAPCRNMELYSGALFTVHASNLVPVEARRKEELILRWRWAERSGKACARGICIYQHQVRTDLLVCLDVSRFSM